LVSPHRHGTDGEDGVTAVRGKASRLQIDDDHFQIGERQPALRFLSFAPQRAEKGD